MWDSRPRLSMGVMKKRRVFPCRRESGKGGNRGYEALLLRYKYAKHGGNEGRRGRMDFHEPRILGRTGLKVGRLGVAGGGAPPVRSSGAARRRSSCWSGAPLLRLWWRSWRTLDFTMWTLVVTGTGAAYLYSTVAFLAGSRMPLYFEATAVTTAIVLGGQILEQRAHARTDAAIRALLDLAPPQAHRIRAAAEEDVPVAEVKAGDRLRVRPGEKVPVDGRLVEGAATSTSRC